MSNCILAYPDKTLAATGLSGGSWNSSFPLTNLALKGQALKARSSNALAASTTFDVNLGAALKLRLLALIGHNLSIAATIRVRLSTVSNFTSNVYDSGTISAYPDFYDDSSNDWGQPVLTNGKPSTADALEMRYPIFFCTPATVTAQYARIEITDTSNPSGYVEISRCFIAPGLQPVINMLYGAQHGYETDTQVQRAVGGAAFYNRIEGRKTAAFTLGRTTRERGMGHYLEMERYLNLDRELFFVADPDATSMSMRLASFMGTLKQLSPLEIVMCDQTSKAYSVVESV